MDLSFLPDKGEDGLKIIHFSACRKENCTFFHTILTNFALKSIKLSIFAHGFRRVRFSKKTSWVKIDSSI